MGRISRTMQLARAAWEVLKADRELVALPVLSLLASLLAAASFLVPMMWIGRAATDQNPTWVVIVLAFTGYRPWPTSASSSTPPWCARSTSA